MSNGEDESRLRDKVFGPLINCRNLTDFRCARFAARTENFMRLADARPDMTCQWFDPDLWESPRSFR
ncbi:hypothetical protein [Croceicoccus sediminis]|uniref:hypothetical protein n=1 Tax=Croceicoccus sediminis TaxID=2571150 RepID=UPI001183EF2E|nr:hypothetical protein [Croceicoccus sediminis]